MTPYHLHDGAEMTITVHLIANYFGKVVATRTDEVSIADRKHW